MVGETVQMVRTHNLALAYLERAGDKGQTVLGIQMFSNFANRVVLRVTRPCSSFGETRASFFCEA